MAFVRCSHESFPDEDGVGSVGLQLFDVRAGFDAALGDEKVVLRGQGAKLQAVVYIYLEILEVPVVDADDSGSCLTAREISSSEWASTRAESFSSSVSWR